MPPVLPLLQKFPVRLQGHLRNTQLIHELLHSIPPIWPGTYRGYGRLVSYVLNEISDTA